MIANRLWCICSLECPVVEFLFSRVFTLVALAVISWIRVWLESCWYEFWYFVYVDLNML